MDNFEVEAPKSRPSSPDFDSQEDHEMQMKYLMSLRQNRRKTLASLYELDEKKAEDEKGFGEPLFVRKSPSFCPPPPMALYFTPESRFTVNYSDNNNKGKNVVETIAVLILNNFRFSSADKHLESLSAASLPPPPFIPSHVRRIPPNTQKAKREKKKLQRTLSVADFRELETDMLSELRRKLSFKKSPKKEVQIQNPPSKPVDAQPTPPKNVHFSSPVSRQDSTADAERFKNKMASKRMRMKRVSIPRLKMIDDDVDSSKDDNSGSEKQKFNSCLNEMKQNSVTTTSEAAQKTRETKLKFLQVPSPPPQLRPYSSPLPRSLKPLTAGISSVKDYLTVKPCECVSEHLGSCKHQILDKKARESPSTASPKQNHFPGRFPLVLSDKELQSGVKTDEKLHKNDLETSIYENSTKTKLINGLDAFTKNDKKLRETPLQKAAVSSNNNRRSSSFESATNSGLNCAEKRGKFADIRSYSRTCGLGPLPQVPQVKSWQPKSPASLPLSRKIVQIRIQQFEKMHKFEIPSKSDDDFYLRAPVMESGVDGYFISCNNKV